MDKHQTVLLARVRKARAHLEQQQDAVDEARAAYIESVRRLYDTGMPLREIAEALGLSHQRVHQMVSGSGAQRAERAKRIARGATGLAVAIVLVVVVLQLALAEGAPRSGGPQALEAVDPIPGVGRYTLAIRGRLVRHHPELVALTSERIRRVAETEGHRLRVEADEMCVYFTDWTQVEPRSWMLTGPPAPCTRSA
jgi:hypothetical protein